MFDFKNKSSEVFRLNIACRIEKKRETVCILFD